MSKKNRKPTEEEVKRTGRECTKLACILWGVIILSFVLLFLGMGDAALVCGLMLLESIGYGVLAPFWYKKPASPGTLIVLAIPVVILAILQQGMFLPGEKACVLVLALAPFYALYRVKRARKNEDAHEENARKLDFRDFYDRCAEYGLLDVKELKPDQAQRMQLLAESCGVTGMDVEQLQKKLEELKPAVLREERDKEAARLEEQAAEEKTQLEKLTAYVGLTGRDKPIKILTDAIMEDAKLRQAMTSGYIPMQKESDGMFMAGAAAGIGGVVPAAASLAHTERRNGEIRDYNQGVRQANLQTTRMINDLAQTGKGRAEERKRFGLKLVEETDPQKLMKQLTFKNTETKVTETGTVWVTTQVSTRPFHIFDSVPAYVDGWVKAEILEGTKKLGEAKLAFPLYGSDSAQNSKKLLVKSKKGGLKVEDSYNFWDGVAQDRGQNSTLLVGLCLKCGQPGKTYSVRFVPGQLWAIEQ